MGFFERSPRPDPPHPRREPRLEGELTPENLARVFAGCVDYNRRSVAVGGNEALRCELIFLAGMVRMERVSASGPGWGAGKAGGGGGLGENALRGPIQSVGDRTNHTGRGGHGSD